MAEDYLDPLQGIVRQTIREELSRLEPRFQRITMSQDTDGHPAELYGAGGKIYYRKDGDLAGVEIGTSSGGSHSALIQLDYASAGHTGFAGNPAVANQDMDQHTIFDCSDITLYDGSVISPELHFRVPLDEGFSGFKIDYHSSDGMLRFQDRATATSVMTLSDAGRLNLWDDLWLVAGKEVNFGSPYTAYIKRNAASPYELVFYDEDVGVEKTLSELAVGSGGDMLKSVYDTNDDGVVDSAAAVAWTGITGKPGLCQNPAVANLDMDGKHIFDLAELKGAASTDFYFRGSNVDGSAILSIGMWDYSTQKFMMYRDLDMGGKNITNAVFAGYALESWVSSNFNNYSHPTSRQCSSGNWAWGSISGKPGLCQNPAVANLDMDGKHIFDLAELKGAASTDFYFRGSNVDGSAILSIGMWDYSTQKFMMYRDLDMGGKNITNAVFAGYALESWVSSNFNNYSHPTSRQCSSGNWAWGSISGKPGLCQNPAVANLDMDGKHIFDLAELKGAASTDFYFRGSNVDGSAILSIGMWDYSTQKFMMYRDLDMGGKNITNAVFAGYLTNPASANLDMDGKHIFDLAELKGAASTDFYFRGSNVDGSAILSIGMWDYSTQKFMMYRDLDMGGKNITNAVFAGYLTNPASANLDMRNPSSGVCNNITNVGTVIGCEDLELGCSYFTTPVNVATLASTVITFHKPLAMGGNDITGLADVELSGSIKLDGSTGTVKIEENDGTGDMEFTVASGDVFVFKTV